MAVLAGVLWLFSLAELVVPKFRALVAETTDFFYPNTPMGRGLRRASSTNSLVLVEMISVAFLLELSFSRSTVLAILAVFWIALGISLLLFVDAVFFNVVGFLVPTPLRTQPGALREWLDGRRPPRRASPAASYKVLPAYAGHRARALFDNAVPTRREISKIFAQNLGLRFVNLPAPNRDLAFLVPYAEQILDLGVADAFVTDVGNIAKLSGVETLSLWVDQQRDVDLSGLESLREYHGPHRHFESIVRCRTLRTLSLQGAIASQLGEIEAPLEELELVDVRGRLTVPNFSAPAKIETVGIYGTKELDLRDIAKLTGLRVLSLEGCRSIINVGELAELPQLRGLSFTRCTEIEGVEQLLEIQNCEISLVGKNPFGPEFRDIAQASGSSWSFQPS